MRKIIKLLIIFLALVTQLSAQSKEDLNDEIIRMEVEAMGLVTIYENNADSLNKAIALTNKVIEKNVNDDRSYFTKSLLLINMNNIEEAMIPLNKAIELNPAKSRYLGFKGLLYYLEDDTINAYRYLKEAVRMSDIESTNPSLTIRQQSLAIWDKSYYTYIMDKDKDNYINSLKKKFIKNPLDKYSKSMEINIKNNVDGIDISKEGILNELKIEIIVRPVRNHYELN